MSVDVLVITALPLEYDAVREVLGSSGWVNRGVGGSEPYATTSSGGLSVALARPPAMAGRSTSPIATTLTNQLQPACLAMAGVCAGKPGAAAPGDVIVAAPAYQWDEGKWEDDVFLPDNHQFPLDSLWLRAVQEFDPTGLPSHGTATDAEAKVWFLERLHKGESPRKHPARPRYFPNRTWQHRLEQWESDGLIAWDGGELVLTTAGQTFVEQKLYYAADGPDHLPFQVMAGPMASGNAVMKDETIWHRLEASQRRILAIEMEGATVATVAAERRVPHWLVAKGVMDHANMGKDDRFKSFAARASAEVLFALLGTLLKPTAATPPPPPRTGSVPGPIKVQVVRRLTYDWQDLADWVGIAVHEIRRFRAGDEGYEVWAWLENRNRLAELPDALAGIGRTDLADLLRPHL
ncbi:hypothetical protein KOI35_32300 [Actinoplanes bogorensis]|uniref:Nucleoside phosphorylase domain-containing protein n=1 Tax=Paractinoplanes bogorensis TaxID=1610840 RepID=A0ABS5YXN8_9ACTN|nr:hypothetical protein [Actinoplanes bogorensis]MBU2668204.1 hypothetical protein [Actinoplanes bogorensis]